MWNEPDPGGGDPKGPSPGELSDLRDQNEQQLLLIAQLKGMLQKEQSMVTKEKVEEYVNTLSKVKAKRSRTKKEDEGNSSKSTSNIDSNKKEKINLMKKQLEENKARLAERGKNQKGIEEMVSQLQAQLNDSQQLISLTPLNASLTEPKTSEYTIDTPQNELYNILVVKEKKISDLMNKTQKLEGTVLDLQENLKEKDSVIDARTKAITLMTDSLSKKGKTTLDALEETKQHMRTMQENFVVLESEMKARQMALLNDLKVKNSEIADLQESLRKYENEDMKTKLSELEKRLEEREILNKENLKKKSELEKLLEETNSELNRLKSSQESKETENDEITRLKKLLEENNKNMIKVKAQHKSKLKEMKKKIDEFKKGGDVNELVVKLQNENSRLSEKIAELEDEKGSLQLKMVESTSSNKDELDNSLKEKMEKSVEEIEEKDKIISLLESEILSLKDEIKSKEDKLDTQVTSEISSIQFEEKLEEEMKKITKEKEDLTIEKTELLEKIETLTKEKTELSSKLDNYIQENIELIDKLEKLSAEKVSSAESIEIVEGLTHQEKLELAAYQKSANVVTGALREPQEDSIEPPEELNESVLQLNEDTAELLQKIEMFNQERKEVMHKMEMLKDENSTLLVKIKELENNRDALEETYEQLQNEKEVLLQEKEEFMTKQQENPVKTDDNDNLHRLQKQCEDLLQENEELKRTLKNYDGIITEKHELESELRTALEKNTLLEENLQTNLEEINNYQTIIEETKNELINSSATINELQTKLNEREQDISELNAMIDELSKAQSEVSRLGELEEQLDGVKAALNEQSHEYETELAQNAAIVKQLNSELVELNRRVSEQENELETKKTELLTKEEMLRNLQNAIEEKDKSFKKVSEEMRDRFIALQKQLDGNDATVQNKLEELTNKNKEQLEKMKKLAANLKKKTQALQELQEEFETSKNESERLKEETNDLREKLNSLEQINADLQNYIQELKHEDEEKLNQVNLQQEMSASLHEDFNNQLTATENVYKEKITELEMVIEMDEAEIERCKDRINVLEENLEKLQNEKRDIDNKNHELEEKLNLTSNSFKEKALLEDQLELKLAEITANDEELNKQLQETTRELEEARIKNKENDELIRKLKIKVKKSQDKVNELQTLQNNLIELENTNDELRKQIVTLEANQRQIQNENANLHKKNMSDYEKIETDYQTQLEQILKEKNDLTVECERCQEKLKETQQLQEELFEEKSKLQQEILSLSNKLKNESLEEKIRTTTTTVVQETVPTFHWPEQQQQQPSETQDWFLQQHQQEPPVIETSKDALISKVKALEFLLYNVEQQKEIALSECTEIITALTTAIYEKVKNPQNAPSADLESQIISEAEIADKNDSSAMEFVKVDPSYGEQSTPVVEEIPQPKKAYLCYNEEDEEIASKPHSSQAFGENDDGWGWGPEELKLEEEHVTKVENTPQMQHLRQEMEELKEKLEILQTERENHLQEIQQLQVKSGKLIKKCKELKSINEQLKLKSNQNDVFDLNETIQEELKSQVKQLEKKLKELTTDLEKEKQEKQSVLKRVDVLTTANERMIEMKEIQDTEVLRWQRKHEEISEKLQQYEWDNDDFQKHATTAPISTDVQEKIEELQKTVQDLTLDNEELQTLLEEQRALRMEAEKHKIASQDHELSEENKLLKNKFDEQAKIIENLTQNALDATEKRVEEIEFLQKTINELRENLKEKDLEINEIHSTKLEKQLNELTHCKKENEEMQRRIDELLQLEEIKRDLENTITNLNIQLEESSRQIEQLKIENNQQENLQQQIQHLQDKINEKETIISNTNSLQQQLEEKQREIVHLQNEISEKDSKLKEIQETLNDKNTQFELQLAELAANWQTQVDQRGADVAESWKLHLETVQSEFSNVEYKLKSDITNLETKCNLLTNENTELRRNVDAEIRNEIDKISAMNKSLEEKQMALNDLENEVTRLKGHLTEKDNKLANVDLIIDTTQKQFDEKREVVEEVVRILERNTNFPISYDKGQIVDELQRQLNAISEKENDLSSLNRTTEELQSVVRGKDEEIVRLNENVIVKEQELDSIKQELVKLQNEHTNCSIVIQDYQQKLEELQRTYDVVQQSLEEKNQLVTTLNDQITNNKYLETELTQLKSSYTAQSNDYQLQQDEIISLKSIVEEMELKQKQYEEEIHRKDINVQTVQNQLEEALKTTSDELTTRKQLEEKLYEQSALIQEDEKQLNDLKALIEEQTLKIEELKKELFEKSNEYDSLIAEMDMSRLPVTQQPITTSAAPPIRTEQEEDLSEPVSRAELDLALYMLHQRDVRCEELTVELTQLLEERDTLQLRLSNAIREKEEIRRKINLEVTLDTSDSVDPQSGKSSEIFLAASGTELAVDPLASSSSEVNLATKLSELKNVGYKKDKTFVDEQQLRRLQQFSIMQEHIHEASKLPPEAAAKLVDATYTLSRDVQSPSKVLLNWLWGKSTPKVNDT